MTERSYTDPDGEVDAASGWDDEDRRRAHRASKDRRRRTRLDRRVVLPMLELSGSKGQTALRAAQGRGTEQMLASPTRSGRMDHAGHAHR